MRQGPQSGTSDEKQSVMQVKWLLNYFSNVSFQFSKPVLISGG